MDDDTTYAAYERELAPYRAAYMDTLNAEWAAYQARMAPAQDAYSRARAQLRGKYRLPTLDIGPIRD